MIGPARLAVDLGTSHTVAVVRRDGQPPRTLLFDGSPVLPSGVFAAADGALHTGRDAERLAQVEPARFEPHPKRRVDEGTVLLGPAEVPVAVLLAAVLGRVAREARDAGVDSAGATVLTCPADWGGPRRNVLREAAKRAGLGDPVLVDEPVAAATYCLDVLHQQVPVGASLAVFDFGGGTFDVAVVRREPAGLRVLATGGLDNLGGLDVDAALVGHLGQVIAQRDPAAWRRLASPADTVDLRERRALWTEVRGAKEMLSRTASAPVQLPRDPQAMHLTRDELERVAGPLVDRAVDETRRVLERSGTGREQLAGVFLVGGSSRIPLVASRLHARLGLAPTVPEQPELPVAHGALLAAGLAPAPAPGPRAWPAPTELVPPRPARRRRLLLPVLAGVLALALAVAGALYLSRSRSGGGAPSSGGAPTSGGQAAAAVPAGFVRCGDGGIFCPKDSRCWAGLVETGGRPATARSLPCTGAHSWESFAVGYLPADADRLSADQLLAAPAVQAACSETVMRDRSVDAARTAGWRRDVLPQPSGLFHCVAGLPEGGEWTGPVFRTG